MPMTIMERDNDDLGAVQGHDGDQHHQAGKKRAHVKLPFRADVPQFHLKGDRTSQAHHDQRRGLDQCVGKGRPTAKSGAPRRISPQPGAAPQSA